MTTISSVILVDKRIQDHETIVAAIKADGVRAIVFDVADIDAQGGRRQRRRQRRRRRRHHLSIYSIKSPH